MKIAIDFDGVILDWEKHIRAYGELYSMDVLKSQTPRNKQVFDMHSGYNWDVKTILDFAKKYYVPVTHSAPPLPLCKEMLDRLKKDGHTLLILTARNGYPQMVEAAKEVMKKHNIIVDGWIEGGVVFNGVNWIMDKAAICAKNNIDVMIEDSPDHAKKISAIGIPVVFLRDKTTPTVNHNLVYDVDNWTEVYRVIKRLATNNSKI
ncbi:MAG: hypothetical protein FWD32_02365 [Firmicutes bacterium]|nr:hypothetical protein [Bacillota bacterium]